MHGSSRSRKNTHWNWRTNDRPTSEDGLSTNDFSHDEDLSKKGLRRVLHTRGAQKVKIHAGFNSSCCTKLALSARVKSPRAPTRIAFDRLCAAASFKLKRWLSFQKNLFSRAVCPHPNSFHATISALLFAVEKSCGVFKPETL